MKMAAEHHLLDVLDVADRSKDTGPPNGEDEERSEGAF